ncbi:MAG TPA: HNH endonuclease signature motif containing protein [Gemmatimonadaceae bacterium]|nr:HNH endonuclease signature motif containing protein [Gemmatimonadaceae bacterium]
MSRSRKSSSKSSAKTTSPRPAKKASPRQAAASGASGAHRANGANGASRPATSRRKRSRRGGSGGAREPELTSHPTGRRAYSDTREWLLKTHGPICAYCARKWPARVMTLDHVAPRRGQTAYDRRDNLVLACPGCNAAKRDLAPLAFLLGSRARAANLVRYGSHLSQGLIDLARSLVPKEELDALSEEDFWRGWGELEDGESPYSD